MGNDDNKVTILLTSDNIGPLTRTHDLHYNGVSYYENPLGLYQKMLESEKGNQHLFTRVSSDEALLNNWPTVDLSSAERPFNQSIAAKNVDVYSTISNYMDLYNLSYDLAVDLYNKEILYAKLLEKYTKEYGNGNLVNPYRIGMGNNWLGLPLNRVLSALDWDNHKNSFIDELAGIWDDICRYKGDYENGIGLDKSRRHVQALFNYSVKKLNEENEALLRSRLPALLYDADKAALYRNMNNMFLSGLLVNDGYKAMMAAQDPTTPEGQARMDQLYLDGMSNYRPISYIGHGMMLGLYPFETAATLGAGYVGGKITDEVVRRTSDYDSWEDLALRKFGMFPTDALISNPGMWIFSIPGARFGRDIGAEVGDLYTGFRVNRALNKSASAVRLPNEYISTLPESFPHLIEYRPPARTSTAGVSSQPRGNQNTSWTQNFMGTVKRVPHPGHDKLMQIPHPGLLVPFKGNRHFGPFMGNGLELTVFLAGFGNDPIFEFGLPIFPRTVYKMPSGSFFNHTVDKATGAVLLGQALDFPTLEDMRVFNLKILGVNNQVPNSSRIKLVGYTWSPEETINGVTHPASFHPVFELEIGVDQAAIEFDSNLGPSVALNVHDVIKSGFTDKGWTFTDDRWGGYATNHTKAGDLTVTDLHRRNIGMTLSGKPVILDPGINYNEPWPIGTKTSFPNRFNLRASDFDFDGNFPLRSIGRVDHSILGNFRSQLATSLKSNAPATTPVGPATPAWLSTAPTTPVAAPVVPVFPVNPGIPTIHFASPTNITWKPPMFLVWQPPLTVSWSWPRSYSLISNPPSTTLIRANLLKVLSEANKRILSLLNKINTSDLFK